jgi:hypothetical protein
MLGIANLFCTEGPIINSKWLKYEILKNSLFARNLQVGTSAGFLPQSRIQRYHLQGPNLRIVFIYKFICFCSRPFHKKQLL